MSLGRILLTGADGMVGTALKGFLRSKNYIVDEIGIDNDVTTAEAWAPYKNDPHDVLIHLAALAGVRPSFDQPDVYLHNNVEGTRMAFEHAAARIPKVLYASSSNAYEWWGNPYAATKMMNEVQAKGKGYVGMRFHTIWPGRDDMLFKKLEHGEVEYINNSHYRDFVHIDDICSAILTIIENYGKVPEVVDIGTGHATPVSEVAKLYGFTGEYRDDNPTGERVHTKADIEWLLQLGWTPTKNIIA